MERRFNNTYDHRKREQQPGLGGVGKKQEKVTEKINCANFKDNRGLKFINNHCAINSHPSLLDSFAIKVIPQFCIAHPYCA